MLSKRSFGIAGAAMLGTVALLGANAANAQINLDASAMTKEKPAVNYAMETIVDTVDSDQSGDFYEVNHNTTDNQLNVRGAIGVAAVQDERVVIELTLTGAVFGNALADDDIHLYTSTDVGGTDKLGPGERVRDSGGASGESMVRFRISNSDTQAISATDVLVIDIEALGVSMGGASVSMTAYREAAGAGSGDSSSYMNAVSLSSGIAETATPNDVTTFVEREYTDFGVTDATPAVPILTAYLGTFAVTAKTGYWNAGDGTALTLAHMINETGAGTRVTITGDFSFINPDDDTAADGGVVYMANDEAGCATRGTNLWILNTVTTADREDRTFNPRTLAQLGTDPALCIAVVADTEIPRTEPYMAMTSYDVATGVAAKHPAMGGSSALGKIERDGTTVELPYLTTDERYNQRIIMVNRGDEDVVYFMSFTSEDGIMAEAGSGARGMLDAEATTVLHMRNDNVVTITGGPPMRTSGTLTIESVPGDISVATNQTNAMDGSTDTVVLH